METNIKIPKNPKLLYCEACDYKTVSKKDFNKHLETLKHINLTNPNLEIQTKYYTCNCGKEYKHSSSLCDHKKNCSINTSVHETILDASSNEFKALTDLVLELVKNNTEIQKQNQEFQKQIIESPKTGQQKFICVKCDYKCSKESDYNKHLNTLKHSRLINTNVQLIEKSHIFKCSLCDKEYKSNVGLWKHKKKCIPSPITEETILETLSSNKFKALTDLVLELVKNNTELQKQTTELQKQNQDFQKQMINLNLKIK
jgi:hypothetical protein